MSDAKVVCWGCPVRRDCLAYAMAQHAEVDRLAAPRGATRVDIGEGDVDWVVMVDPDSNEFCVLRTVESVKSALS